MYKNSGNQRKEWKGEEAFEGRFHSFSLSISDCNYYSFPTAIIAAAAAA